MDRKKGSNKDMSVLTNKRAQQDTANNVSISDLMRKKCKACKT